MGEILRTSVRFCWQGISNLFAGQLFKLIVFSLLIFSLGVAVGWLSDDYVLISAKSVRQDNSQFKYINPILECELEETMANQEFVLMQKQLKEQIGQIIAEHQATDLSVYFRDLNNGPWFGWNEKAYFSPASMLKVPTMIAILKRAEREPDLLKRHWLVKDEDVLGAFNQNIKPASVTQVGQSYSVAELLRRAIIQSDNVAVATLNRQLGYAEIEQVFREIGVDYKIRQEEELEMTVKNYASFFRLLYNASYLNRDFSEYALGLLAQTSFRDGLVAGVGEGVVVAHKFGERYYATEPAESARQLHDCGIIYFPQRPYLLCVMTKGTDLSSLQQVIASVSRTIYQEAKHRFK